MYRSAPYSMGCGLAVRVRFLFGRPPQQNQKIAKLATATAPIGRIVAAAIFPPLRLECDACDGGMVDDDVAVAMAEVVVESGGMIEAVPFCISASVGKASGAAMVKLPPKEDS